MAEKDYLYQVWVRLWHLSNAILFLFLICTGLCLHYAGPGTIIIPFEISVSIHNITGILLCFFYLFFVFMNIFTRNGKYYRVIWKGLISRASQQFIYYTIGIFKNEKPPFPISKKRKFNPMQLLSYVWVMYFFMPFLIISGVALLFPGYIPTQILGLSGIHIVDLIHITSGFILSIFMLIHIYFCTLGKTPLSNFKSMINGWHEHYG